MVDHIGAGHTHSEIEIDHQMQVDMFPVDDIPDAFADIKNDVTTAVAPFGRPQTANVYKPAIYRSQNPMMPEHNSMASNDHISNLLTRDQSGKFRKSSNDGRELRRAKRERPKTSSCVRCVT